MSFSKNMKKYIGKELLSIIICLVMITTACSVSTAEVKSLKQPFGPLDHVSYSFSFLEPTVQLTQVDTSVYSSINMPGCLGLGQQAGDPTMPVKFIQLLLPPMTTVGSVQVSGTPVELHLQGIDLTRERISPYQNELPLSSSITPEFVMNNELYASSNLYPSQKNGNYHIGYSHGYAILDL
jgi:hypothetical protein